MTTHYVIDTSVLMQAYIEDDNSESVIDLLATLDKADIAIHYLDHGLAECGNVFWKRVRFAGLPAAQAATALTNLLSLPLEIHPSRSLLSDALTLALGNELSVYDALYVVLASSLQCPLITADAKQRSVAGSVKVSAVVAKDIAPSQPSD